MGGWWCLCRLLCLLRFCLGCRQLSLPMLPRRRNSSRVKGVRATSRVMVRAVMGVLLVVALVVGRVAVMGVLKVAAERGVGVAA